MSKTFVMRSKFVKDWEPLAYFKERHRSLLGLELLLYCLNGVPCGVVLNESITDEEGGRSGLVHAVLHTEISVMDMDELVELTKEKDDE